jgi:hypothetical protein
MHTAKPQMKNQAVPLESHRAPPLELPETPRVVNPNYVDYQKPRPVSKKS